jgi:hypothetical protein
VSDIADFLRARYRQEAHVARLIAEKTGSEHWKADWRRLSYNDFDARVVAGPDNPVFDGYGTVGAAEFVSGYSPARVLADLAAKLALVDLHALEVEKANTPRYDPHTGQPRPEEFNVTCAVCGWSSDNPASGCSTLRVLAQPFAGHPDHKGEEWAP